ncbi:hypothetical protein QYS48_09725 [Marivirga arenosa]|uniref:Uncharacterized protein n=1 Tax=Marivirga arenosa TaxID=3059076 RepID=A0AA49GFN9_9BACT|nr:hypothetical protein [Marivirga sp. ABR2-2]WKK87065.2 hypothetical protein QYS48_09725 [Marivirga sp. ABR2-2]
MNYLRLSMITLITIFSFQLRGIAQEILSQSEEIRNMKIGEYNVYRVILQENGSATFESFDYVDAITEKKPEKNFPNEHFQVLGKLQNSSASFLPDNWAFPATYIQKGYEGNKQMQEDFGYIPQKIHKNDNHEERVVYLNGWIFNLSDWKNKDDYTLWTISIPKLSNEEREALKEKQKAEENINDKKKKGLKGKLLALQESAMSPEYRALHNANALKMLQDYLDAAFAKQEKEYAAWIKNPGNAKFVENVELIRETMIKFYKKDKEEYYNSEEYRRIKANNEAADQARANSTVTLKNESGGTICVTTGGSSKTIGPGGSSSFQCSKDIYYGQMNGNTCSTTKGSLIVSANQSCGDTITVQ